MKKFSFDEAGLQGITQTLYALDDVQLAVEVAALEKDFNAWILLHFELTTSQDVFFKKMGKEVIKFLTDQSSFAVTNRLPIELLKTGGKSGKSSGEEGDKLFEPKSKLQAGTDQDGNFQASGSLLLSVTYS